MVQTSARLLALLSLLQIRREWTGQELADRLEVGPRTIRRDVEKLRSLGYPVEATMGHLAAAITARGLAVPPTSWLEAVARPSPGVGPGS